MTENTPILQQLHDRFDIYARHSYIDDSVIGQIAIEHRPEGYKVTTYPGGGNSGIDGFVIDLVTPTGMFGEADPTKVETSRINHKESKLRRIRDIAEFGSGMAVTADKPAAPQGLILPGDAGFELFTDLHHHIRNLHEPLRSTMKIAGSPVNPTAFDLKENTNNPIYNHRTQKIYHQHDTTYNVLHDDTCTTIQLDASTETNMQEKPSPVMTYRFGEIKQGTNRTKLALEALVAFSGLHTTIRKLYK